MHSHIKFFGGMVRGLLASLILTQYQVPSIATAFFGGGEEGGIAACMMEGKRWKEAGGSSRGRINC